jgi:alkylhydroperoxidase/carboxymuconolactone decarboxylase family protein YurZ
MTSPDFPPATPICDAMGADGQWSPTWDTLYALDPGYAEKCMAMRRHAQVSGGIDPRTCAFVAIAITVEVARAQPTAAGVRLSVRRALELGATPRESLSVLEMATGFGPDTLALSAPVLAEEAADASRRGTPG